MSTQPHPLQAAVSEILPSLQETHNAQPDFVPLVFIGNPKFVRRRMKQFKLDARLPRNVAPHSVTVGLPKHAAQKLLMGCPNGGPRCAGRLDSEREGHFWVVVTNGVDCAVLNLPATGNPNFSEQKAA